MTLEMQCDSEPYDLDEFGVNTRKTTVGCRNSIWQAPFREECLFKAVTLAGRPFSLYNPFGF